MLIIKRFNDDRTSDDAGVDHNRSDGHVRPFIECTSTLSFRERAYLYSLYGYTEPLTS